MLARFWNNSIQIQTIRKKRSSRGLRRLQVSLGSLCLLFAWSTIAAAQNPDLGSCANSQEVGCVIPRLFGAGITLPQGQAGNHVAHFYGAPEFFQNFLPLNTSIATQLALLPIPSPASGFIYSYEQLTGATFQTPQTFGPILTERGETIGRGRISAGVNYQRFRFDEIDGNDLGRLPGVLRHIGPGLSTSDVITTLTDFNLKIDQFTFSGSSVLLRRWMWRWRFPSTMSGSE